MKHVKQQRSRLARVVVKVEVGRADAAAGRGITRNPVFLVLILNSSPENGAGVYEDMIPTTVGIPVNEQAGLVNAVDDAVPGDKFRRTCQPGKCGVEIHFMEDVVYDLVRLNDSRPPCLGTHAYATLGEIPLSAAEDTFSQTCPWRWVVRHRAIV